MNYIRGVGACIGCCRERFVLSAKIEPPQQHFSRFSNHQRAANLDIWHGTSGPLALLLYRVSFREFPPSLPVSWATAVVYEYNKRRSKDRPAPRLSISTTRFLFQLHGRNMIQVRLRLHLEACVWLSASIRSSTPVPPKAPAPHADITRHTRNANGSTPVQSIHPLARDQEARLIIT